MGTCTVVEKKKYNVSNHKSKSKSSNENINITDVKDIQVILTTPRERIIKCDVEFNKENKKYNYSSQTNIGQVKQFLRKQLVNTNYKTNTNYDKTNANDKTKMIKLFHKGKELKPDSSYLGSFISDDIKLNEEINLKMVCFSFTEEMASDQTKIDFALISHLSNFCDVHKSEKALSLCVTCALSICHLCEKDHTHLLHDVIKKNEIINYPQTLKNISEEINIHTMKEIDIDYFRNYFDTGMNFDDVCEKIEKMKNKQNELMRAVKQSCEDVLPPLMNYKENLDELSKSAESWKILNSDTELADFVKRYTKLVSQSEKKRGDWLKLRKKVKNYKLVFEEFKLRLTEIFEVVKEHYDLIKDLDISVIENVNINESVDEAEEENENENESEYEDVYSNNNNNCVEDKNKSFEENDKIHKTKICKTEENKNNESNNKFYINSNKKYTSNSLHKVNSTSNFNKFKITRKFTSTATNTINLYNLMTKTEGDLDTKGRSKSIDKNFKQLQLKKKTQILTNFNKNINIPPLQNTNTPHNENLLSELSKTPPQNHIINIEVSTKNLYIYYNSSKVIVKKEFKISNANIKRFEAYHSTLNYINKFYISGGYGYEKKTNSDCHSNSPLIHSSSRMFCEYSIETNEFTQLTDMPNAHSYHTLNGFNDYIVAISGFNSKKVDKYSLENNTWSSLPDLVYSRTWPSSLIFTHYLYVFGGLIKSQEFGNKIFERFDLKSLPLYMNSPGNENLTNLTSWEALEIAIPFDHFIFNFGVINFPDIVRIVGGKFTKLGGSVDKSYSFNKKDKSFNSEMEFPYKDEFDGRIFLNLDDENKEFAQFSSLYSNRLYIFNSDKNLFEIIECK